MLSRHLMKAVGAIPDGLLFVGSYVLSAGSSVTSYTLTHGGNLTGGSAASANTGDLIVAFSSGETSSTGTAGATGYTESVDLRSGTARMYVGYKVLSAADTTTEFVWSAAAPAPVVGVMVFRRADASTPLDVTTTTSTGFAAPPDPPSITPVTTGALILVAGGSVVTDAVYTSTAQDFQQAVNSNGNVGRLGLGYYDDWTSGAYDPPAFGGGGSVNRSVAATVAIRPA